VFAHERASRTMRSMGIKRYVALGDSFTEGVGDTDPTRPNGVRGWADRVAEVLATQEPDFGYANLAIRGRKLPQILSEQLPAALALQPDLVTLSGGGNDVLRPKADIDALAALLDEAVGRARATGAEVVLFTLSDTRSNQAFKVIRGRVALWNEFVREVAEKHGARLADPWREHDFDRRQFLDPDRLHLNAAGHVAMAVMVLDALGVEHGLERDAPATLPALTSREQRAEHVEWVRTFLAPWIGRRLTGRSSGDGLSPKYGALTPLPTTREA
jgi:lysophospholipase L1-like esterase